MHSHLKLLILLLSSVLILANPIGGRHKAVLSNSDYDHSRDINFLNIDSLVQTSTHPSHTFAVVHTWSYQSTTKPALTKICRNLRAVLPPPNSITAKALGVFGEMDILFIAYQLFRKLIRGCWQYRQKGEPGDIISL